MAKYILILMVLLGPHEFPQHYYTFSELKGLNDSLNNTHLFYRLFWSHSVDSLMEYSFDNSMYHYDLSTGIDSFFIPEFGSGNIYSNYAVYLMELEFWNNDPTKYIYSGSEVGMDPAGFITRFDNPAEKIYIPSFGEFHIDISKQNDSVIYTGLSNLQSVDSGYNWITKDWDVGFLSLSPFNDQEIFANGYPGLYKSTNAGNDFQVVDTTRISDLQPQFFYDADGNHIYRVFQSYPNYLLSVSDNNGNAFSWTTKYSSLSKIFLSINPAQSGELFLADGKDIYRSGNYIETFDFYRSLDRDVVGIYKEPNSPNLYAATKYKIYKITNDSMIVLKSLPIPTELFDWFPLAIGNKWVCDITLLNYYCWADTQYVKSFEITKDTLISGIRYFKFEPPLDYQYKFVRIDSLDGHLKSLSNFFNYQDTIEISIYDFLMEVGDTVYMNPQEQLPDAYYLASEGINFVLGENRLVRTLYPISFYFPLYSLSYQLGYLGNYSCEFGGSISYLKGCIINGIVYGDTTVTDVNEKQLILKEFALYQNYPNPFNPSTTINYDLPVSSQVIVKIFDILGREIKTIVNEFQQAGSHQINFQSTAEMPSGVYFYQLSISGSAKNFISVKKMLLLK